MNGPFTRTCLLLEILNLTGILMVTFRIDIFYLSQRGPKDICILDIERCCNCDISSLSGLGCCSRSKEIDRERQKERKDAALLTNYPCQNTQLRKIMPKTQDTYTQTDFLNT